MHSLQRLHFKKEGLFLGVTQHRMRSILFRNAIFRMIPDYHEMKTEPNQSLQTFDSLSRLVLRAARSAPANRMSDL